MNYFQNRRLLTILIFILGFSVPLIFALYTDHAWEDWYITYRASKNLATGNGLVYNVGERLHTFTSPLGVLIPALLNFITGNRSDDLVLWLFRIFSCSLLGSTAVLFLKIADHLKLNSRATTVLIGMFLLDAKIIDFSINGMETALMIFFLTLLFYALVMPLKKPAILMGIVWGGLMWSRPDSFVYIIALSLGFFIFDIKLTGGSDKRERFRQYFTAGIIATLIYTPWLIWAWSYYGSFVPNTVVAKGISYVPTSVTDALKLIGLLITYPISGLFGINSMDANFMPAYAVTLGGWIDWLPKVSKFLSWIVIIAWMMPFVRPVTRAVSLAALVAHIYLFYVSNVFPWYIPSVTLLSIIVLALLIDQILTDERLVNHRTIFQREINIQRYAQLMARVFTIALLSMSLCLILSVAYQLYLQQSIIENGNRKQIGLWLHENAAPKDHVFLECLGYIGFYSNLKTYDFPGLASPEMIAARRKLKTDNYRDLIDYLKPEWVVLRPIEAFSIVEQDSTLLNEQYKLVKIFDVSKDIEYYSFLPGRPYLLFDQTFMLFRLQNRSKTSLTK